MGEHRCLNCKSPDVDSYDLMVRGNEHSGVFLCDECYETLRREIVELD